MTTKSEATIDDLYRVPEDEKAEIVNGELVLMPPPEEYLAAQPEVSTSSFMLMRKEWETDTPFPTT